MYIEFVKRPEATRENFRLTKDEDRCYPKGKRSVAVKAVIDGAETEMMITSSAGWSTASTTGQNGWVRLDGKTYWMLFDAGFDATKAKLKFVKKDGLGVANPKREPLDATKEGLRVMHLKEAFALRAIVKSEAKAEVPAEA